jgi:hypothetical protein
MLQLSMPSVSIEHVLLHQGDAANRRIALACVISDVFFSPFV